MRIPLFALAAVTVTLTATSVEAQPASQPGCNGQTCTFPLSFDDAAAYLVGTTGAAFSGQEEDANSRTLPNGTHLLNQNMRDMTYRDSKGRVRSERHAFPAPPAPGRPANPNDFVIAEIHDPVAGFAYVLDPVTHVAHRMAIPQDVQKWDPSNIAAMGGRSGPRTVITFLGAQAISGANANGYRSTFTGSGPGGDPIVRTNEDWYAVATGVRLLSKLTRPGNDDTITETNYSEAEPDASLFQIPDGYKTVDESGPFQVVHAQTGGGINGTSQGPQLTGVCEEGVCSITFDPGNAPTSAAVTGAPYSGHEIVTNVANNKPFIGMPGGIGLYRDSNGRLRTDPVSVSLRSRQAGETTPSFVRIEDPVAGYVYILSSATQIAYRLKTDFRSFVFQPNRNRGQQAGTHTSPDGVSQLVEILGPQTVSGVAAMGQRTTRTSPAGTYDGNDKPVVVVNESWTDPKTGVTIQMSNTGLQTGVTRTMPDYKEGEPDAALFQIPAGYKIVDETGKFSFDVPAGTK